MTPCGFVGFLFFCRLTGCSESVSLPQLILIAEWRINAAVWRLMDLGEAVWFTGLPPSRFHHLAFYISHTFNVTNDGHCPRTWTVTFLLRGPSNSQKKIPCHVPIAGEPSIIRICSLQPTSELLQCESELPSPCR